MENYAVLLDTSFMIRLLTRDQIVMGFVASCVEDVANILVC